MLVIIFLKHIVSPLFSFILLIYLLVTKHLLSKVHIEKISKLIKDE